MLSKPLFAACCLWAILASECKMGWLAVLIVPPMLLAMILRKVGL